MIRARQRRATNQGDQRTIAGKERRFEAFVDFLNKFVFDLNQMALEGWGVIVEGARDEEAVRILGYVGPLVTIASIARLGTEALLPLRKFVILTDLDREGRVLAARYVKMLSHEGFRTSLVERKRLRLASRGVFRHVENLSRFSRHEV
ncbi:MAG: hypothetical protein LYZ70_02055 [Nitrososphaerales archaeon]|nr:hypothetical protein [Nitrososphaerales archaeon]